MLQRIALDTLLERRLFQRHPAFDVDLIPDPDQPVSEMSELSRRLLGDLGAETPDVADKRRTNALKWRAAFARKHTPLRPLFEDQIAEGPAPYRFVLQAPDADTAHVWYERLWRSGIPVETWPDLPPELIENKDRHDTALILRKTLLFLATHQTFRVDRFLSRLEDL